MSLEAEECSSSTLENLQTEHHEVGQEDREMKLDYESKLAELHENLKSATCQVGSLEARIQEKDEEICRGKLFIDDLNSELEVQRKNGIRLANVEDTVSELRTVVSNLEKELTEARSCVSEINESFSSKVCEVDRLKNEISNLQDTNTKFTCEQRKLKNSIRDLHEENTMLRDKDKISQGSFIELQTSNDLLKEEIERFQKSFDRDSVRFTEVSNELQEAQEKIEKLLIFEEQIEALKNDKEYVDGELAALKLRYETSINEDLISLKDQLAASKNEGQTLRQQLLASENEQLQLQEHVSDLKSRLELCSTKASEENQRQLDEIKELTKSIHELNEELSKATAKESSFERQYISSEKTLQSKLILIHQLEKDKKTLSDRVEELENKLALSSAKIADLSLELTEKVDAHLHEIGELGSRLEGFEASDAEKSSIISQLQGKVAEFEGRATLDSREMRDFEGSIANLSQKLKESKHEAEEMQAKITSLKEELSLKTSALEDSKTNLKQNVERLQKFKQLIVKVKKELAEEKKNNFELEERLQAKTQELEGFVHNSEQQKIEFIEVTSEKTSLQQRLHSLTESHKRSTNALQNTVGNLKGELETLKTEHEGLRGEYEAYKVRVHSVLKQQNRVTPEQVSILEAEKKHLSSQVNELRTTISDLQGKVQMYECEKEEIALSLERQSSQIERLKSELKSRDNLWNSRTDEASAMHNRLICEHLDTIKGLSLSNKELEDKYKETVAQMNNEKERELMALREELEDTQERLYESRQEAKVQSPPTTTNPRLLGERSSGEGMENPGAIFKSKHRRELSDISISNQFPDEATVCNSPKSPLSLERLLQYGAGSPRDESFSVAGDFENNRKVLNLEKRISHLSELLQDTESSNMHLLEQNKVLKQEIRRLEKNQERQETVNNLEYLKNVVVKYLTLRREREQLLPVLVTVLRLSEEEIEGLQRSIEVESIRGPEVPGGWSSYLPRWTGMS